MILLMIFGREIQKKNKATGRILFQRFSLCITNVDDSAKKKIHGISANIGDKVIIKIGRSKKRTGFVSAISRKGTVKLHNCGKWSEVVRVMKRTDITGDDTRERDSEKKSKVTDRILCQRLSLFITKG